MILLALFAGSWWLGRRSTKPSGSSQTASGNTTHGVEPKEGQGSEVRTMAFVLNRGSLRSGEESESLVIPPDISEVRLEARVEADYPHYEAVLQTPEGTQIWSKKNLQAHSSASGKNVRLYLSSTLLAPGDYILVLRGLPTPGTPEIVAEYVFRVSKK
jgi:hypothetical protein